MKGYELKAYLDEKVAFYNQPKFIALDPISVPHRFESKQDIELAAFFAATFAWGQRITTVAKANDLIARMQQQPHRFIMQADEVDLESLNGFCQRTFNADDARFFALGFRRLYTVWPSMEDALWHFSGKSGNIEKALVGFHHFFFPDDADPRRHRKHLATPAQKSACKRLNMMLRWLVRRDRAGVDFGLWQRFSPADLLCPLDLHVGRVAREFGLLSRHQNDWQTTIELTNFLKTLDPKDPVKYDFALFSLGIDKEIAPTKAKPKAQAKAKPQAPAISTKKHTRRMKLNQLIEFLNEMAPPALQEDYDNAGLLVGDRNMEVTGVVTTLDCLPATIDEAIEQGANVIVAHHPFIFKGIKKVDTRHWAGQVLTKAIKHDVAIFAIHTNLDNYLPAGLNRYLAHLFPLQKSTLRPLRPLAGGLSKLEFFVPESYRLAVMAALFSAGAGQIGAYSDCSFSAKGEGTFTPGASATPFFGKAGQQSIENETIVEMVLPSFLANKALAALRTAHPYQEVAYYLTAVANKWEQVGSGAVFKLETACEESSFLAMTTKIFQTKYLKHSALLGKPIDTVAVCGGSGFFLLADAIAAGADVYITGDIKHHDWLEADGKIVLIDIGHWESERLIAEKLALDIGAQFTTFAVNFSRQNQNPANFFIA